MKKILLGSFLLLALGAGCAQTVIGTKEVAGDWYLAFDLPSGWVTAHAYESNDIEDKDFALETNVDRSLNEIFLQGSDKPIYLSAGATTDGIKGLVTEGKVVMDAPMIDVTLLDTRRVIPSEATDLGHGFYSVELCADGGECQIGGRLNYDYYLVTDDAKYKFVVHNLDEKEAEDIITSAKVVTKHTDEATVDAQTE